MVLKSARTSLKSCVISVSVKLYGPANQLQLTFPFPYSPAPSFEWAAVFGVVVQLSHALLEQVSHLTAFQKGQSQLVLGIDKRLEQRIYIIALIAFGQRVATVAEYFRYTSLLVLYCIPS